MRNLYGFLYKIVSIFKKYRQELKKSKTEETNPLILLFYFYFYIYDVKGIKFLMQKAISRAEAVLSRCGSVTLEGKQHSVVFLYSRAASLYTASVSKTPKRQHNIEKRQHRTKFERYCRKFFCLPFVLC